MGEQCFTIYCHTNKINGKKYVGQTRQTMAARWRTHLTAARCRSGDGHCRAFGNAIRKYGADGFDHEVLEEVDGQDAANEAATRWIAVIDCVAPHGYNLDAGGRAHATHDETRRRLKRAWVDPVRRAAHSARMLSMPPEWYSECARRANAALTVAQRHDRTCAGHAAQTPEQRSARQRKGWAVRTPEQRAVEKRKAWETRRAKYGSVGVQSPALVSARLSAVMTHEQRSAAARRGRAAMSPEARSENVRKANASRTPEQRSEAVRKGWEARRAKMAGATAGVVVVPAASPAGVSPRC